MDFLARFQAIDENNKASVVRKLMQSSTPNFDFLYLTGLSVLMATLGVLADSPAIVIGSMLIAPVLYPVLGVALGLVMSDSVVLGRSLITLAKSLSVGLLLSILATVLFGDGIEVTGEILARTEPSLISMMVAIVAGLAVSYALAQPEWSETLPGIAISVALIPPLAVTGVGIAWLDVSIISGSLVLLAVNVIGIVFAAMVSFSLMNLHDKKHIAESTIKKEDEREREEQAAIDEIHKENGAHKTQ